MQIALYIWFAAILLWGAAIIVLLVTDFLRLLHDKTDWFNRISKR